MLAEVHQSEGSHEMYSRLWFSLCTVQQNGSAQNTIIEIGFNIAIRSTTNLFWKFKVDADEATGGDHRDCL